MAMETSSMEILYSSKTQVCAMVILTCKLLTKDRQCYFNDKVCVLCNNYDETLDHIFFSCAFSNLIWSEIRSWLSMKKNMVKASTVLKAFRGISRGSSSLAKLRCNVLAACIYMIWNARYKAIFLNMRKPQLMMSCVVLKSRFSNV